MKNVYTIKIKDTIASTINSRDIVAKISKIIKKVPAKTIVLDFSNVDFVSRSATHELLKLKNQFNSGMKGSGPCSNHLTISSSANLTILSREISIAHTFEGPWGLKISAYLETTLLASAGLTFL